LHEGDAVSYAPPAPVSYERVEAEPIPLDVLFEDPHLIVVDKPAGMVVHPAPGHPRGTLVAALLAHCDQLSGVGGELRPGIVHRLDRLTSGVMLASKSDRAHEALARQFEQHSIERRYLAIVRGVPRPAAARIDTLHGRHPSDRKRYTTRVTRGRQAITDYRTLQVLEGAALLEARLETGRTHQVRVHLADRGHPLLGDPVYGGRQGEGALRELGRGLGRQALHARLLAFDHPLSGERMSFETPLPADMRRALVALGGALPEERR
jgi:23S rRNA pseudouridine1911/1915/1917 synthase